MSRRTPRLGTPENEYKEEHYRRIAYANVHFAQAVPGWETDRGRISIVYGPPDRIKIESAAAVATLGSPQSYGTTIRSRGMGKTLN